MSLRMDKLQYAQMFGPTIGDKLRLADTNLIVEIEKDYCGYGDENRFGGGKTVRDGLAMNSTTIRSGGVLDFAVTGVVIIDHWGIIKADIGIKDGKIVGVGKAGNPDTMDNVSNNMIIGAATEVHDGTGLIATAGGIDTHVHYIAPEQIEHALYSGVTTMIGGGVGTSSGSTAASATPGAWNIEKMIKAAEAFPMNLGFLGKGSCSTIAPIEEQIKAGALGLKVHEDWAATPAAIDAALKVADDLDIQVALHADSLNEAGFVESTMNAIDGRVIHMFHTEGAGGGHAPDILKSAMYPNVLPASTNPTLPYTVNTIDEHLDMLMAVHHLSKDIPEDIAFADSRIRPETIAAEDVLHDMGVLSITSTDSQAMGRVAELVIRTWQAAHSMKKQRGSLDEDKGHDNDNFRAKRFVAKYTINPAIAQGISQYVGSLETGKMADIVLWDPALFGAKPEMIIKGGMIAAGKIGDPNGATFLPEPLKYRHVFGSYGKALSDTSATFVSKISLEKGITEKYGLQKQILPVSNCRNLSKKDMIHNGFTPKLDVDPETFEVRVDGKPITGEPATELPMAQRYFLF